MSRFVDCNYKILQIRSSYKQRAGAEEIDSLNRGIAKIPEQVMIPHLP